MDKLNRKQTLEKFNEMMLAAFYLNQCKRLNVYVPGLLIKKHFDEIDENTQQHLELWEVKIGFEKQNIFIFLDGPKAKKKGLLV